MKRRKEKRVCVLCKKIFSVIVDDFVRMIEKASGGKNNVCPSCEKGGSDETKETRLLEL